MSDAVNSPNKEKWKDVPFIPWFEVSTNGRIRNKKTGRIRATPTSKRGYPVFSYNENGKQKLATVHRCVASAFIPNTQNLPQVNHKDGDKTNNHVWNLEWVTACENFFHAKLFGLHKSDGDKAVAQIKDGKIIRVFKSSAEASRATGIGESNISNVCRGYVSKDGKHCLTAGGFKWKRI